MTRLCSLTVWFVGGSVAVKTSFAKPSQLSQIASPICSWPIRDQFFGRKYEQKDGVKSRKWLILLSQTYCPLYQLYCHWPYHHSFSVGLFQLSLAKIPLIGYILNAGSLYSVGCCGHDNAPQHNILFSRDRRCLHFCLISSTSISY